jgi:hypothetical protein
MKLEIALEMLLEAVAPQLENYAQNQFKEDDCPVAVSHVSVRRHPVNRIFTVVVRVFIAKETQHGTPYREEVSAQTAIDEDWLYWSATAAEAVQRVLDAVAYCCDSIMEKLAESATEKERV